MDEKEARMHKGIGIRGRTGLLIASAAYTFALLMMSGLVTNEVLADTVENRLIEKMIKALLKVLT